MVLKKNVIVIILYFFELGRIFDYFNGVQSEISTGFQVRNCLDKYTYEKYTWSRRSTFEMSAYDIDHPNLKTIWELYGLAKNGTERSIKTVHLSGAMSIFTIEPFELKAGDYKLNIFATINNVRKDQKSCFLRIRAEGALAIIYGGTSRDVSPGEDVAIDGTLSLDFCNTKAKKALTYKWQCTQLKSGEFCKDPIGKGPKFTIPGHLVADNDIFMVNLTIKNEDKRISATYQKIIVKRNSMHLIVRCTSNCPPVVRSPNIRKPSLFAATCLKHCEEECKANWAYSYEGGSKPIQIGTTGTCSLKSCSFNFHKDVGEHQVSVSCIGKTKSGQASLRFSFQKEPEFNCKLNKKIGTSYDTFNLICTYDETENIDYFEVYATDSQTGEIGEFITSWSPPFVSRFRVAPHVERICIQAININGTIGKKVLPITVTPYFNITDSHPNAKIRSIYFDPKVYSVRYAIENGNDIDEAISRMRGIWDDVYLIKDMSDKDADYTSFIYNFKLYVISDIEKIPITTYDRLTQVTTILRKVILYQTPRKADPLLARSITGLCKKLAYDMKILLGKNEFPMEVADRTADISNVLLECGIMNFNENTELLTPMMKSVPLRPHESVPFEETIMEDYETYDEFNDQYYQNLENIVEAVNNSLRTNLLISENMVKTIPDDSRRDLKNTSAIKHLICKYHGDQYRQRISVDGIEVTPSIDILEHKDTVLLSLMAWKKNIFWFSFNKDVPITYIANLDFVHLKTNNIIDVKHPHTITFKIIKKPSDLFESVTGIVTVPTTYLNETKDENYMEEYVKIHRINLFHYQALKVEFHDLEENKFMVVVKNFEVPIYEDFKNSSILFHKSFTSNYYRNDNNYDSWFYVAILPVREMLKGKEQDIVSFPYRVTFSSTSCYSWSFINDWERNCKVGSGTNDTHISCECDHLSIVSGSKESARSREVSVDGYNAEVEVQDYYLIFLAVLAMFITYCIMILCARPWIEKEIYYAADNLFTDTYAYLVVVQTGGHRKTTARVVMKITGAEGITTHVLNYPDPECKILQHGMEDWIVVTTEHCVGNISNIVLWHDNYGIEPIWVCNNIIIYDMQTYETWFFKIDDTMSEFHRKVIVAKPRSITKRQRGVFRERHGWSIFEEDMYRVHSYIVRLTTVYSKLITPLVITMCCYGMPMMEASDSIDPYTRFSPDWFFVGIAVASGIGSFIVHSALRSIFKSFFVLFIIVPMIMASNTLLIVYGFWIPHYSSVHIVTCWMLAVLVDIIVYENVQRLVKEYLYGTTKIADTHHVDFPYVLKEVEIQREFVYQEVGSTFVRDLECLREFRKTGDAKKQKVDVLRRQKLRSQLTELLVFGLYIILLYVSVLTAKDVHVFHKHNVIKDLIEGDITRTSPKLSELNDIPDIYNYINNTLIEGMQHDHWYGNFYLSDPGLLADFSTKYIGVARIRQHRIMAKECESYSLPLFLFENRTCYPDYSYYDQETRLFDGSWKNVRDKPLSFSFIDSVKLQKLWMFSYFDDRATGKYYGQIANYPSGGYNLRLGRTKANSHVNFNLIKSSHWIDRLTRSIIVEFLTYNANYNMFTAVMVLIERGASGTVHTKSVVLPERMLFVNRELENTAIIMFAIFGVWVLIILLNRTNAIVRRGLIHLKSFWNFLDFAIIVLSVTVIVIYILRLNEIKYLLSVLEHTKHNEFVVYFHIFYMNFVQQFIGAILVLIATIRLWKLLRFFKMFQLFEHTIMFGLAPYLVLMLYHFLITITFTTVLCLTFGDSMESFKSMRETAESLIRIYMANFHAYYDLMLHHEKYSALGLYLITVYMFLVKPIYRLYVAAEMCAYIDARMYHQEEEDSYSFIDYLKEEIKFQYNVYKSKIKRLRGGREPRKEVKKKVTPKEHDVFYANVASTTTSSIKTMTFITMVLLINLLRMGENRLRLTDDDVRIMLEVCHYFLVNRSIFGDRKEVFFKAYMRTPSGSKRLRFVDHRRMTAAKLIVETLLSTTERPKDLLIYEKDVVMNNINELLIDVQESLKKCLAAAKNIKVK